MCSCFMFYFNFPFARYRVCEKNPSEIEKQNYYNIVFFHFPPLFRNRAFRVFLPLTILSWLSTPKIYNSGIRAQDITIEILGDCSSNVGDWNLVEVSICCWAYSMFGFFFDRKKAVCYLQVFLLFKLSRFFNIFVIGNKLWWETSIFLTES